MSRLIDARGLALVRGGRLLFERLGFALDSGEGLHLTGVYEGVPIGEKSVDAPSQLPDRIRLFRRAILDEWVEEGEEFEHLIRHILIHEAGHHFGLSDEAMHALEEQA